MNLTVANYNEVEQQLISLLETEDLDKKLEFQPSLAGDVEATITRTIAEAYGKSSGSDAAHRLLQHVLYRINRLKLFWYDDLRHYTNECSFYLAKVRDRIESAWQQWELSKLNLVELQELNVRQALCDRVAADLDPPFSEDNGFVRNQLTQAGYRCLLAIGSLDGLVEASSLAPWAV